MPPGWRGHDVTRWLPPTGAGGRADLFGRPVPKPALTTKVTIACVTAATRSGTAPAPACTACRATVPAGPVRARRPARGRLPCCQRVDVGQAPFLKTETGARADAVTRIADDDRVARISPGDVVEQAQRKAPLLLAHRALRNTGLAAALRLVRPASRQIQLPLQGQDAVSVTACTLTATWQFARLPGTPQYCRATPACMFPSGRRAAIAGSTCAGHAASRPAANGAPSPLIALRNDLNISPRTPSPQAGAPPHRSASRPDLQKVPITSHCHPG